MIQKYGSQPLYKRKLSEYKKLFIPEWTIVNKLNNKGIKVYKPKLNKLRVGTAIGLICLCIVVPLTNWAIPGIVIWGMK